MSGIIDPYVNRVGLETRELGWVIPPLVATVAATATDILAAGLAKRELIIINETNEPLRIRWDGSDATSVHGMLLAQGEGFHWKYGRSNIAETPTGKISGFSTNPCNVFVAYK